MDVGRLKGRDMESVKRVEIVVEAAYEQKVRRMIRDAGADGYTLVREVSGGGDRGDRDGDGLTNAFTNLMFVVACDVAAAEALAARIQPVLREGGGLCLVSDAGRV